MFKDNKKKFFLILILLPLVYFGLDFATRKTKTRKHFIVVSIENFYVENKIEQDPLYSALSTLAKENNLHLRFETQKVDVPINWMSVVGLWPDKVWKRNVKAIGLGSDLHSANNTVPAGQSEYYVDLKNNLAELNFANDVLAKRIAENSQKAFFLLINYQFLIPPFYDVHLSQTTKDSLLSSYVMKPENFKSKTFLFSLLFDELKVLKPTSLQSVALKTYSDTIAPDFWIKAYDEEVQSKEAQEDAAIIKKLYTERKMLIFKSIEVLMNEVKKQNELQDTELLILTTHNPQTDAKALQLERYFREHLRMSLYNFSLSPKAKPVWKNLGTPSKLNAELLSRMEDF